MKNKTYSNFLLFSLFGISMWFFGNLYEAIVITPNLLLDTVQKLRDWQHFFSVTNPAFFYIPMAPLAMIVLIALYLKITAGRDEFKKYIKRSVIFTVMALGVGIYIISQINFKLFFGDVGKYGPEAYNLALLWNLLNLPRLALVGFSLYNLFKAYSILQKIRGAE